jgi:fructose-1,6-bisphosphatase/inositol monophosphatase family enzyme
MDYAQHLTTAMNLAREAVKIIASGLNQQLDIRFKADRSKVTQIDLQVNQLVLDTLGRQYEDYSVYSEEASTIRPDSEYTWVCDPLDGTHVFVWGLKLSMFSLALCHKGNPVLGVAACPYSGKIYQAVLGQGTYCNGQKLQVSTRELYEAEINCDIWKDAAYNICPILSPLAAANYVTSFGSCVRAGVLVAEGLLDGQIFAHNTGHDVAAIKILVEEAGGKVTDLFGSSQLYDGKIRGAVLTNGVLHSGLIDLIRSTQT